MIVDFLGLFKLDDSPKFRTVGLVGLSKGLGSRVLGLDGKDVLEQGPSIKLHVTLRRLVATILGSNGKRSPTGGVGGFVVPRLSLVVCFRMSSFQTNSPCSVADGGALEVVPQLRLEKEKKKQKLQKYFFLDFSSCWLLVCKNPLRVVERI